MKPAKIITLHDCVDTIRRLRAENRRLRKALRTPEKDNGYMWCRYCKAMAHQGDTILHYEGCLADRALYPLRRAPRGRKTR